MPRHVLDDSERLFLEMARLEQAAARGVTAADLAEAEAEAEAHQDRGEAGEADATDDQEEEFIRGQIARHERDADTDPRSREAVEFFRSELGKLLQDRRRHKSDPDEIDDDPGMADEPGSDEPNRFEFFYYDAQTGNVVQAPFAPDVRRWYRLVEDGVEADEAFEQGEFPLIFDTQMSEEAFLAMPQAERDALIGDAHRGQYQVPGAPLLPQAEDLQRRMGWRSSAVQRPVRLASASATPSTPRLGGQPGLPSFAVRPEPTPDPTAPDPLMEGLKEPLFPLAGAQRFVPQSVTDVEGLDRQLEPDRLRAGSWWPEAPKPNELLTPRTGGILDELERQQRMDLPEPTETAGLVPLDEYLRRLAG